MSLLGPLFYNAPSLIIHTGLVFALSYILQFVFHVLHPRFALRHVPGPPPSSWLWGEEWGLYHGLPGVLYIDWHKRFGKVVKFSGVFGHQIISLIDQRAINYIFSEAVYDFPKPNGVRVWFQSLLGEGILWVEGKDAHETQRRRLAPGLSQQSVRNLTPIFYETSARMAAQWSRLLDQSPSAEVEIEATNWAGRFALDTIGRAAFSYDFECLSGQPHALAETLDGLTNQENKASSFYMRACFWLFPSILSIGKKGEMIRETRRELGEIVSAMWKDAKKAGDSDGNSLMSLMLRAAAAESSAPLDEEGVASQMRTTISAAYEPVSATIDWVLYELAKHPDIQSALREELATAGDPSFDELMNSFPLLDAVFKETLRLHPVILEFHHAAGETVAVPLSEPLPGRTEMQLIVPKGTIICVPVNVIQQTLWESEPDIDAFRPNRWLQRKREGSARHGLFSFSDGPRGCLGKTFAMTEIKALTVTLVRQFSFSCPYDIEPFQSFVIRPRIKGESASSLPLVVRKFV